MHLMFDDKTSDAKCQEEVNKVNNKTGFPHAGASLVTHENQWDFQAAMNGARDWKIHFILGCFCRSETSCFRG
jgi:hypothetical protein